MNVCFFGSYDPNYSRNKILIDGLLKNKIGVFHCRSNYPNFFQRYVDLIVKYKQVVSKIDVIYVAFVGHLNMPIAWLLARLTGKKVVFDMFYSMFDTYVYDRQSTTETSLRAKSYKLIDKLAATLADIVITDTKAHANYFIHLYNLPPSKFKRIFVGGDDTLFVPRVKPKRRQVTIEFHGMFTRLHGAEFYVEAAKLLENEKNIKFLLIGNSKNYTLPIELFNKLKPKNMRYIKDLPVVQLAKVVAESDICIGHIGITKKAKSVITNKIFHGLATKTAVIVPDCVAMRELLVDKKTALFVRMGDARDLANKILFLAKNSRLRTNLAEKGFVLFKEKLTNEKLGRELISVLTI